jgi:hypothetical protein
MLEILMAQIRKDLYHYDAAKNYVGVVRFIDVDVDLTPKDTPEEKEVSTHGKGSEKQPEFSETEQRESQPQGNGNPGKDTGEPPKADTDESRTADTQPPVKIAEQIEKAGKNVESS